MARGHKNNWKYQLYCLLRRPERFGPFKFRRKCFEEVKKRGNEITSFYMKPLLDFSRDHVPYYANLPKDTDNWRDWFPDLPPLRRKNVQQSFEDLKADDLEKRKWSVKRTSGSMGKPVSHIRETAGSEWSVFSRAYYYRKFWDLDFIGGRRVILWGAGEDELLNPGRQKVRDRFHDWVFGKTVINPVRLDRDKMSAVIKIINREKPSLIHGYANCIYQIARFARENKLRLHSPKIITASSEMLYPHMTEMIQEQFGCRVYNWYGTREVGGIAGECAKGNMHIFNFNNFVEIVDSNYRSVAPGEQGRVVVTNLHNYAMPFIRYDLEDLAVLGDGCSCGDPMPTILKISGRVMDYFAKPDGSKVSGVFIFPFLSSRPWIETFHILQRELDLIEIFWVRKAGAEVEGKEGANESIRKVMGPDCQVIWHEVDEIPKTSLGKQVLAKSLVS